MAYFQTQGRGGQTHSNLKINIFFWFPTENYKSNHPLIRELVLVPPLVNEAIPHLRHTVVSLLCTLLNIEEEAASCLLGFIEVDAQTRDGDVGED